MVHVLFCNPVFHLKTFFSKATVRAIRMTHSLDQPGCHDTNVCACPEARGSL